MKKDLSLTIQYQEEKKLAKFKNGPEPSIATIFDAESLHGLKLPGIRQIGLRRTLVSF